MAEILVSDEPLENLALDSTETLNVKFFEEN
jgi:hypothetical protein